MLQGLDAIVILKIKQTGWRGRRIHAVWKSIQGVLFLVPHDLRGHVLRIDLLTPPLLVLIDHAIGTIRVLRLLFLIGLLLVDVHSLKLLIHVGSRPIIVKAGCDLSLEAWGLVIGGAVQLLLHFLELPHQVKLRLGAPQVKYSVLVRRRDDTI